MNSHEYANKLKELADFILSKPEFDSHTQTVTESFWYFGDKALFLSAVKALGSGRKEYSGDGMSGDVDFVPTGVPDGAKFYIRANRSAVCRKIRDAEYECEPLLSQAEEAAIGV